MSAIEYNNLLFEISEGLDELNVLDRLLFMCRGKLAAGSEVNVHDVQSLFKELEEQNHLGADRLEVIKEMLKGIREWPLFGQVKKFERKRKEYNGLLDEIIRVLDEINGVERLIAICRGTIPEESDGQIQDVRSLFNVLKEQNNLDIDRLDILKAILTETEQEDLLKKVEEFEERRNNEDEYERRRAAISSITNTLKGALSIKMVLKVAAAGITVVTIREIMHRCSTYDQLVTAFQTCVLPAGTFLMKLTEGSVCFTVRAENLLALTTLWNLYQNGTLKTRLYDFLVTDEVRERVGGEEIEMTVTIEEQEYEKACLELIKEVQAATFGDEKRIRRNSDSAMYLRQKEETVTVFMQTPEGWTMHQAGEMQERLDKPKMSQRMDPERYALVQKFLEGAEDTHSVTTKTSDSDYWTQPLESDFAESETSDVLSVYLEDQAYDGIRNPYVLIINNANFGFGYGDPQALYNRENVRRFLEDAGFRDIEEQFNLMEFEMRGYLQKARKKVIKDYHDGFICIIMSHGQGNRILGVDGRAISVEDITAIFQSDRCPQLRKKPKLFFFHSSEVGVDAPLRRRRSSYLRTLYDTYEDPGYYERSVHVTHPEADFLIAFSSTEEDILGEWPGISFITCLMQILRANSHKQDLMTMLARVNEAMNEIYTKYQQITYQLSTLRKKVYFPNFRKEQKPTFSD